MPTTTLTRKSELADRLHKPVRTCIACRKKEYKSELLRVVRTPEYTLETDVYQTKPGRGAYLCFNEKCMEKAVKRKLFSSHLKVPQQNLRLQELLNALNERNR